MNDITPFIQTKLFLSIVLAALVLFVVFVFFYVKNMRDISASKWVVDNQFEKAPENLIQQAIDSSVDRDKFIKMLVAVRMKYGHDGVKIGHLIYIQFRMTSETDDLDMDKIPSFNQD